MATLKEVAKIANVNVSTISRYLSGKLIVTPQTEKRINEAIHQTGYRPNIVAQSLRSGSNPTIAVIVPDIFQPGISGIISGIDDGFIDSEYTLVTMMTKGSAAREIALLNNLHHRMVAGVIVIGHPIGESNDNSNLKEAIGERTPLVFISRNFKESTVSEVCPDQEKGATELTQHLIDRGYRAIGVVVGSKNHPDALAKLSGYKNVMGANGINVKSEWIETGLFQPEATRSATEQLIKKGVDAIFCTSDLMAVSAVQYLQEKGFSIPEDVAVAGYGGTIWAEIFTPKLTTVVVQVEQLGRVASELLMQHIRCSIQEPKFLMRPVKLRAGTTT